MKSNIAILAGLLFLFSCKNFQTLQLEQREPVHPDLVFGNLPAANPLYLGEDGVIEDFNNDFHSWKKNSDSLKVLTLDGKLIVENLHSTGCEYIYKKYNPLNFRKISAIQIKYKADSIQQIPIRLGLKDVQDTIYYIYPKLNLQHDLIFPINMYEAPSTFIINQVIEILLIPGNTDDPLKGKIYIDQIKAIE